MKRMSFLAVCLFFVSVNNAYGWTEYKQTIVNRTGHSIDVQVKFGGATGTQKATDIQHGEQKVVSNKKGTADCLNIDPIYVSKSGTRQYENITGEKSLTACASNTITIQANKIETSTGSQAFYYYYE